MCLTIPAALALLSFPGECKAIFLVLTFYVAPSVPLPRRPVSSLAIGQAERFRHKSLESVRTMRFITYQNVSDTLQRERRIRNFFICLVVARRITL